MSAVARKGDITDSHVHGGVSSTDTITGSCSTVYACGNYLVARKVDAVTNGKISSGSATVFVEGKAIARIGDSTDCGGKIVTGATAENPGPVYAG